jgi:hypothetical protein
LPTLTQNSNARSTRRPEVDHPSSGQFFGNNDDVIAPARGGDVATASVTVDQRRCERSDNGSPPRPDLPEKTLVPYFAKVGLNPRSCVGGGSSVRFTPDSDRITVAVSINAVNLTIDFAIGVPVKAKASCVVLVPKYHLTSYLWLGSENSITLGLASCS